jgi:hypothetical protein
MTRENGITENETTANQSQETKKPEAYPVEDDNNLEEKDLKRTYLFGKGEIKDTREPGMEGQGMGGQSFGKNNITPAGNDRDNPPQNAGEDNAYFKRTQPAEEHPEDENFVAHSQEGSPQTGKEQPNIPGPNELPDQQKVGEPTGQPEKSSPNPQEDYREGTADNDGQAERNKSNHLKI